MPQQKKIKLPKSWVKAKLGDLLELKYGKSLPAKKRDGAGDPVYGSNGVVGFHSAPLVNDGGIIVGRKGSFGEVNLCDSAFYPIDTTYFIDSFPCGCKKYWFYQLRNLPLTRLNRSTAIPGLNRDDAYAQDIFLSPLAEQKRIVEKLDSLLAQVDTIQQRLNNLPDIIKRFRQSVLAAAVSGKLTEQWRAENEYLSVDIIKISEGFQNQVKPGKKCKFLEKAEEYVFEIPNSWSMTAIGNLSVYQQGMQIAKSTRRDKPDKDTLPILRTVNYESKFEKDVHYAVVDSKSIIAEPEDIIISRTGTVGRVLTGFKGVMHNNSFRVIFSKKDILREYLILFLESPICQNYVRENSGRSSQPDLTHTAFSKCPFSIPVIEEQIEIVRLVEQYFALADTLEKNLSNAKQRVDNLTQSILAKAFKGELVPQDPNDEPADKLLERIKAARAEAEAIEKAAKKIKKKTKG